MDDVKYYIGIDFGTTNSAAAAIQVNDNSQGEIPTNENKKIFSIGENQKNPLPSYVAINKATGVIKTGSDAKKNILDDNDEYQVFSSIKSVIDLDQDWVIAGKVWTPIDIAAELFKALKIKIEDAIKRNVEEAVVAVPVGFSSKKRSSVRKAALKAGINILMFISEPMAAFCSRKNEIKKYSNVAVFDWGGGTLDVSVLKIKEDVVNELTTNGLSIAGDDIDLKLAEKVCLRASGKSDQNFSLSDLTESSRKSIIQKCETAKCDLAVSEEAEIDEFDLDDYGNLIEKIDYDYFALLIEPEVKQAVECLLQAISDAGMNCESIDCVLCEGGSSRLRPLQIELRKYFNDDQLLFPKNAMWDIAIGAAQIALSPGSFMLSRPIGILQYNNGFYPLLNSGQRVPTEEKTAQFVITDTATEAHFILTDGEDENSQTFLEEFSVKLRGYSDEVLTIYCYVDDEMVFRMKVHSNRMPDDYYRVWTYADLKLSYEIEAAIPPEDSKKENSNE